MITHPKTIAKLERIESNYRSFIFRSCTTLTVDYLETDKHWRSVPDDRASWRPAADGLQWGGSGSSAWFRASYRVDHGRSEPLFIAANTGGCEALLWINGKPAGIFNHASYKNIRGNHHTLLLSQSTNTGECFEIAVEAYAGHEIVGVHPGDTPETQDAYRPPYIRQFKDIVLLRRDDQVLQFVIDLHIARTLSEALPERSFRKGELLAALSDVFTTVWEEPDTVEETIWRDGLCRAAKILQSVLAKRNGDSAPRAGLIGHSHMDTAWLWTIDESIRKCARTYSNALRLMDQYPEYRFIQSSAVHADFMREHYPDIFTGIQQRAKEGRWEPNGGAWVEPDVNLSGGESLIRQFIYGQRFTQEHFDYTSDTFWLPDTFGYTAALPQILLGCNIRYFLTTKLSWNETNSFPYDTFWWEGIDGSKIFTHFNDIHCEPDPGTLINKLAGTGPKDFRTTENCVRHPDVNQARLISFGKGDGGGGPDFETLEIARRVADVDGCPRGEYTSVSAFMVELQQDARRAPLYCGELYVEGHRGVFTQQAAIKRLNRSAEFALRNLEYCAARTSLANISIDHERLERLWKVLLINQFHDILPGTSIPAVHDRAIRELDELVSDARAFSSELLDSLSVPEIDTFSLHNSLNWTRRSGWISADLSLPDGIITQTIETPWGERRHILEGLNLPPLGASAFSAISKQDASAANQKSGSPFELDGSTILTPFARLELDPAGRIASWVDLDSGRELRDSYRGPLNNLLFGEDIPAQWDNWDIDEDMERKLTPINSYGELQVVANGPLQLRLRYKVNLTGRSWLQQDMVFHSHTAQVDFETAIQWEEPHRYLGVEFPLAIHCPMARNEIQFGHLQRNTHANFAEDRARFEVSQHKWSDLSESDFGVALLNDGKYGLSVRGGKVRLSLMKGGGHPDPRGDRGFHFFTYSLLPHTGSFSVESVVRPAYELNTPILTHPGSTIADTPLLAYCPPNAVVETVKPAENGDGVIVRLYDAAGGASMLELSPDENLSKMEDCNMLEEPSAEKTWNRPFGIRSVRLSK
ncbi:alpha-mannosidase [Cerasicoccus arenae]|uniref:Alpha-mannosidase n=1 Tax=Cerasicoccus arenae TaxID=424488 RepID=A0A8J3DHQ8_9BACT|nr:glycoside hydrolase family 38 C-terminal domain-containing protein [Cerasicoccus arenae]MBK1859257.1 alpha-mannosidase [Cerasicoccus arenae]GHC01673.1 alpha-mannosidase [Cerasicoccus arenae]